MFWNTVRLVRSSPRAVCVCANIFALLETRMLCGGEQHLYHSWTLCCTCLRQKSSNCDPYATIHVFALPCGLLCCNRVAIVIWHPHLLCIIPTDEIAGVACLCLCYIWAHFADTVPTVVVSIATDMQCFTYNMFTRAWARMTCSC
jgi:hypothetical protein